MLVIIFNILMHSGNFKVQERYFLPRGLFIIKNFKNIYAFQPEKVGAIISLYIHCIVLVMCALYVWLILMTEFENYEGTCYYLVFWPYTITYLKHRNHSFAFTSRQLEIIFHLILNILPSYLNKNLITYLKWILT